MEKLRDSFPTKSLDKSMYQRGIPFLVDHMAILVNGLERPDVVASLLSIALDGTIPTELFTHAIRLEDQISQTVVDPEEVEFLVTCHHRVKPVIESISIGGERRWHINGIAGEHPDQDCIHSDTAPDIRNGHGELSILVQRGVSPVGSRIGQTLGWSPPVRISETASLQSHRLVRNGVGQPVIDPWS